MKHYVLNTPRYIDRKPNDMSQHPKCYEIKFSYVPPPPEDDRRPHWRVNQTAFVVARSLPEAVAIVCQEFPSDPQVYQAILRSSDSMMIFASDVICSMLEKPGG